MQLTSLAPRARWLFHLNALVRLAVVGGPACVGAGVGLAFVVDPLIAVGAAGILGLVLTIGAIWWPTLTFERWGYALTDRELLIQSGVLVRRATAIPAGRIQHVDTHQGPLDQALGLATLQVFTASGMGADGVIPGLDASEAKRLRDLLVRAGGDDGV
jgi:uncharacterized protein